MSRALPEWIGKTPDSNPPPRVRLRVFQKYDGRCQCGCGRKILAGEKWELEDTKALINGGERRESNFKPWLAEHHKGKTKQDVAEKSAVYKRALPNVGIRPKSRWRPLSGTRASGIRKRMSGAVERW